MSAFWRKYNTATHIYVPIVKRAVVDFAVGADWTPVAGDVKVSIDGAAVANIGTLPVAIAAGNGAFWDYTVAAGEVLGKKITVTTVDAATKAIEDQCFVIETYGNASAEHPFDLGTATVVASSVTGAVGSVTGAVGSVTGAVGSVTGNVGGNVVGSVASVTARVTANTDQINADATSAANLAKTTRAIGRGTVTAGASTTSIPTSAFTPNGGAADQFKGRIITFDADTTTAALRGQSTDITASSNAAAPTFTVTALTTAPASGDTFSVT